MGVFGERHGMQKLPLSKYPNTFFRVSLKAVIENDAGEVLCVQEAGSEWTLPGGGLDHGETVEQGLRRELFEEVALDPQRILDDVQLVYWPADAERAALPRGWTLADTPRQRSLRQGREPVVQVDYHPDGSVRLEHRRLGYVLDIRVREAPP